MKHYISTRKIAPAITAHEAIIQGLAPDEGLYVPEDFVFLAEESGSFEEGSLFNLSDLMPLSYTELAEKILSVFFPDFEKEVLHYCVTNAYAKNFHCEDVVPVTPMNDGYLMELYHGPTSAFKDIALTLLPHLLTASYAMENRSDTVAILTATSGDTGKAALSGFKDVPHTAITVFYPEDGVSAIQKKQMVSAEGNNVEVIAVKGNFDDCQKMVKQAATSPEVKNACKGVTISSANSINIGRLVPQIVYYFSSYLKLAKSGKLTLGDEIDFCVPTGNFGDILAGYLAKKIGLPVRKLICASNQNNVLTDFLRTGTYSVKRDFHTTMSPSMDILVSSNLERLLFFESGNDAAYVRELMSSLKEKGTYTVQPDMMDNIRAIFAGYYTNEDDCARTIRSLYDEEGLLIDPHTAVAVHAMKQYHKEVQTSVPCIVLSTASPYKFCRSVLAALTNNASRTGADLCSNSDKHFTSNEALPQDDFQAMRELHEKTGIPIPSNLADLESKPVRFTKSIDISSGLQVIAARMEALSR